MKVLFNKLFNVRNPDLSNSLDRSPDASIIVLQPGKVGSRTVETSLKETYKSLGLHAEIYHAHALNKLDEREKFIVKTRKNPKDSIEVFKKWKQLKENIESDASKKWHIVNLVRDPVAMKVSALFTTLYQHMPDWKARMKANTLSMNDLDELLYSKEEFRFKGLDRWYDDQIKALWEIDVYNTLFPSQNGFQIYHAANVSLLVIRLEDLNYVAVSAFKQFLNIPEFHLMSVNIGDKKPYSKLYKEFRSRPLREKYVDEAYSSRYANHFYTRDELDAFRRKWLNSNP